MNSFINKLSTLITKKTTFSSRFALLAIFSFFVFFTFVQEEVASSQHSIEWNNSTDDAYKTVLSSESPQLKVSIVLNPTISKINLLIASKSFFLKIKQLPLLSDQKLIVYTKPFEKQKSSFNDFIKLVFLSSQHYPPPYYC